MCCIVCGVGSVQLCDGCRVEAKRFGSKRFGSKRFGSNRVGDAASDEWLAAGCIVGDYVSAELISSSALIGSLVFDELEHGVRTGLLVNANTPESLFEAAAVSGYFWWVAAYCDFAGPLNACAFALPTEGPCVDVCGCCGRCAAFDDALESAVRIVKNRSAPVSATERVGVAFPGLAAAASARVALPPVDELVDPLVSYCAGLNPSVVHSSEHWDALQDGPNAVVASLTAQLFYGYR